MQGNVTNKNKRMYPTKILVKECERYNKEVVEQNQALGELNHPERINVDPKEASHRITKMWVEGNNIHGKALILDTPNGRILKALLEGGTRFGVSSRAVGSLKQCEGYNEVGEDFRLACVDAVLNPSAPDAMVNHIMESKNYALVDDMIVEVNDATEKAILAKHGVVLNEAEPTPEKISEEQLFKMFEGLVSNIDAKLIKEEKEEHTLYAYDKAGKLEHEQNYKGQAAANHGFYKRKEKHHSVFVVNKFGDTISHSENGFVRRKT
jgi:hypothetical protein